LVKVDSREWASTSEILDDLVREFQARAAAEIDP